MYVLMNIYILLLNSKIFLFIHFPNFWLNICFIGNLLLLFLQIKDWHLIISMKINKLSKIYQLIAHSELSSLRWLQLVLIGSCILLIKERGSVPPHPEKTHKTVPKSAECYKCILCGQNFYHFSTICISAIKPFRGMIFCMDFIFTL